MGATDNFATSFLHVPCSPLPSGTCRTPGLSTFIKGMQEKKHCTYDRRLGTETRGHFVFRCGFMITLAHSLVVIYVSHLVKILRISHKDHISSEEVRAKIQQAIGPHEDLLTIVKRRKLQWYGHVSRLSGLVKTILQGTVKGGRRQGRQKKRWEDNIREWTGLELT